MTPYLGRANTKSMAGRDCHRLR